MSRDIFTVLTSICFILAAHAAAAQDAGDDFALIWSSPADGTVDAARTENETGRPDGIRSFELLFDRAVTLDAGNVEVVSTAAIVPTITGIAGHRNHWRVELSNPIPAGVTTVLSIDGGRLSVHVHSRPGDADGNLISDADDIKFVADAIAVAVDYDSQLDINRDGTLDKGDVAEIVQVLAGKSNAQGWIGAQFEEPPVLQCCCTGESCAIHMGACTPGSTPTPCPCRLSSCNVIGG